MGRPVLAQEIEFYDTDGKRLSKKEFLRKSDSRYNLALSFQTGKTTVSRLVKRDKVGRMSPDSLRVLRTHLGKATGSDIPGEQYIIVNYHPGIDPCNTGGASDRTFLNNKFRAYLTKVQALKNFSQAFIYASNEGLEKYAGIINWFPDQGNVIQRTFFNYHYPCGSFVIISPDGRYYSYYGEYSHDQVLRHAKTMAGQP